MNEPPSKKSCISHCKLYKIEAKMGLEWAKWHLQNLRWWFKIVYAKKLLKRYCIWIMKKIPNRIFQVSSQYLQVLSKGVLTCNTYVNTWFNTYRYFHNTCRYCKLPSPVSIDTIPAGIIRILGIWKSDWNLKQIQSIQLILVWAYYIMANWSLESKLDTPLVGIRNFKYHHNTCRYCVNTYRWG